jgi:RND family efflux transporter MFP subunit
MSGCHPAPPPAKPKPEVEVTSPTTDTVTDYQDFTGRLDAVKTVDIRARVSGYVTEVPFKEGDIVKEGDLLFQIDPRTYEADYNQTVANYKQAVADEDLQEKNIVRAKKLVGTGAITGEEYDTVVGALEKARAVVASAIATRDRAKLYLDYTRVVSPVTGRVSRRFIDPGNLVNADNTVLTTIVTEDPMWAYFDVDERTYLDLVNGGMMPVGPVKDGPKVLMRLANEKDYPHSGTVNFVDNRLNGNTGTIRLRGEFPNPNRTLKSGLFVRIRLPVGKPYAAVIIPDESVQSDQGKKYVFVVKDEKVEGENPKQEKKVKKVEYQEVELGQAIGNKRVIKKGLTGKEQVVTSGMQRIKAGVEVEIKEPKKTAAKSEKDKEGTGAKSGDK